MTASGENTEEIFSSPTLYYLGHKPTFPGEREQIKTTRERERQGMAEKVISILCNFFQ